MSVCGEFAAEERAAGLLIGLGVDASSVTPPAIATTKEAVRSVDSRQATATAASALTADSASAVREQLNPRDGV